MHVPASCRPEAPTNGSAVSGSQHIPALPAISDQSEAVQLRPRQAVAVNVCGMRDMRTLMARLWTRCPDCLPRIYDTLVFMTLW